MKFGTKKSDEKEFDGDINPYLRNFREGDNLVRFIEEIDDWTTFREHFTTDKKSFPCTNDRDTCPGCTSEVESVQRSSKKYATNLQLVQNGLVLPFRIPVSLAKKLFTRAERNGTITSRDYIVMREGKGLDTEYDVEQDEKRSVDLSELRSKAFDIETLLVNSYNEIWGDKPVKEGAKEDIPFDEGDVIEESELRLMSRNDLINIAKLEGIQFDDDSTKLDLIETILEASR